MEKASLSDSLIETDSLIEIYRYKVLANIIHKPM